MDSSVSPSITPVAAGLGWPKDAVLVPRENAPKPQGLGWPLPSHAERRDSSESSDSSSMEDVSDGAHHESVEDQAPMQGATESSQKTSKASKVHEQSNVSRETSPANKDPMSTPLARQVADEARRRREAAAVTPQRPAHTRIFTVANQKGGVGKTTSTVNLAAALSQLGMNVLVIDIDPQGNASTALGVPHHSGVPGIYDVLIDSVPLEDVVQPASTLDRLWCAPATIDLAGAEIELVPLVAREARLRKALEKFLAKRTGSDRIDFVFIDCPPSLGLLTVNAFVSAQEVLIPIQTEYYALEGVSQLMNNITLIREHLNPDLQVSTILLTMYDARTRLSAQVAAEVREHFPNEVLKTLIPRSVRISEAPSFGETVMTYDPASTGALSYREAAIEMTTGGAPEPVGSNETGEMKHG